MNILFTKMSETERFGIMMRYRQELNEELNAILTYWINNTKDEQQGGFYGSINNENIPDPTASKGIVLNSRILWAFSAAYQFTHNETYLETAQKAFHYIAQHFVDKEYGGVFWSVDQYGKMKDSRKQIYGLAFCIYGLTEYYKVTNNMKALRVANDLFECIEKYSLDKTNGGYIEALTKDWKQIDDLRLSDKDDNERKTMNTHLHIIEAYSNLYRVKPVERLREKIVDLLEIFDKYIINKNTNHLNLFMDDQWTVKSSLQSFGHDIEAAWLLQECAEIIDCLLYIDRFKELSIKLVDAATEGLDNDGGLFYEYEPANDHWIREKHSWPQAEAMIGFFNAYELTGDEAYLKRSVESWDFIKHYIKDDKKGEWYWGINSDYSVMDKEKAGFWKCPYHNSRACMEVISRIEKITKI